jgi:hypothetical protein
MAKKVFSSDEHFSSDHLEETKPSFAFVIVEARETVEKGKRKQKLTLIPEVESLSELCGGKLTLFIESEKLASLEEESQTKFVAGARFNLRLEPK